LFFILHAHVVSPPNTGIRCSGSRHLERMEPIMRDVCADFGAEPAEFSGEAERVHLLVNFQPTVAISRLVNNLKTRAVPQAAAGVPQPAPPVLAGETPAIWVVLRRVRRRSAHLLFALRHYIEQQRRPA
jgi:putative transposase